MGWSLKQRLAVSYAALALVTAAVLGGALLLLLQHHFDTLDQARLRSVALATAAELKPGSDVTLTLRRTAYTQNVRLQALGADGRVVADSGSPASIPAASVGGGGGVNRPSAREARTHRTVVVSANPGAPLGVAAIRTSEAPASGAGLISAVAAAWFVAALFAVVLAALLGLWVSRRIAQPVTQLASATDLMAAGDLGVRVDVQGRDELADLGRSFNKMADRVTDTVSGLQQFLSDAAHQIGTPLTALRTDLELIRDGATTNDDRRRIDRAIAQQERLTDLSRGLLRLSRLETPRESGGESVELRPVLHEAVDAIASRAEQAGIDLLLHDSRLAPSARVAANAALLHDVIGNLLDNAVRYGDVGGAITVDAWGEPGRAVVSVMNTGGLISPDEQSLVFERFYRGPHVQEVPGSGLGLSIARAAAQSCGGTLELDAASPLTTFVFTVPLVD